MKNRIFKAMVMVMAVGTFLTGCGAAKPSGTYENGGVSLNFGKDSVIVTEGSANITCDYEIDGETITFELEGDEVTCTYDAEHDVVKLWGEQYSK